MNRIAKVAFLGVLTAVLAAVLCGCNIYDPDTDTSNQKQWGETVEITYEFSPMEVLKRGPYEMRITPQGIVTLHVNGKDVDCIKIDLTILSSADGDDPLYADCVTPINYLKEDLDEVPHYKWYMDELGTEFPDPRGGKLQIGVDYTCYCPLREPLEESGLYWVTVSDRSGYYARSGETYWYKVNP